MADLITQADIEQAIGPRKLAELLDDDGDGVADAALVTYVIRTASKLAKGILWNGWPTEALIEQVVSADEAVKLSVVDVAIGVAGRRRAEFLDGSGSNPYLAIQDRGEKKLRELVATQRRTTAEATVARNANIGTRTNIDRDTAPLTFFPTKDNPRGPGGF